MRTRTFPFSTVFAILLLLIAGRLAAAPISPWIVNPANDHRYALLDVGHWVTSEVEAVLLDGHLVTINNGAEQDWVYQTFGRYNDRTRSLWIGLSDAGEEGQFEWTNGEAVTYTHWASGEPNNAGGEDYVAIGPGEQGRWNDCGHLAHSPSGRPFHGVVEIGDNPEHPSFSLAADSSWLAIAPEGNREGQPITSVGAAFELANPGWNTGLLYDTSAWGPAQPEGGIGVWGPGVDTPVYFRKTSSLTAPVEDVVMLASADDDAQIYINGSRVVSDTSGEASGFGPMDVTGYLVPGENLIAVKAHDSYGVAESLTLHLFGTIVPEPSSLALLVAAAVGLLGYAWQKHRRH